MPKSAAALNGSSGNDEVGTPDWLYRWLDQWFAFNYDAAASHTNRKTNRYSTVEGTWLVGGQMIGSGDGVSYPWQAKRVFVNPPYSRPLMRQFIEKAIAERNNAEIIVMLVKYDASTENGRLLRENFHLEYMPRVKFDGQEQGATFATVIAIARPDFPAAAERK